MPHATDLVGLQILPLLNPNPSTSDGSYTRAQLAGINLGNYHSYYAFQPNVDYFATSISGNASTVTIDQSGRYYVDLQTLKGKHVSNSFFFIEADDALAEDPAAEVSGQDRPRAQDHASGG